MIFGELPIDDCAGTILVHTQRFNGEAFKKGRRLNPEDVARLKAAGTAFVLEPQVRFEGQPGEQWTMFFHDPSGNPIEIKGFRSLDAVYAT